MDILNHINSFYLKHPFLEPLISPLLGYTDLTPKLSSYLFKVYTIDESLRKMYYSGVSQLPHLLAVSLACQLLLCLLL
jgi:hypothetical protein